MPRFEITAPDGKRYEVAGPEGSTAEQALAHFQSQWATMQPQPGDMDMLRGLGQGDFAPQGPQEPFKASWEKLPPQRTVGQGIEQGIGDPVVGGTQLGARAFASPETSGAVDRAVIEREQGIQASRPDQIGINTTQLPGDPAASHLPVNQGKGFDFARMVGNIIGTIPAMAAGPVMGSVIGSASMPVDKPENFWTEKGKQAATGLAAGAVSKYGGSLIAPEVTDDAKAMLQGGVKLSPDQMGIVGKKMADRATSLPITGGVVEEGQRAGLESFNRVTVDKALAPIGAKLPKDIGTGSAAVKWAGDQVSKVYDDVLPKTSFQPDLQFANDIQAALAPIRPYLTSDRGKMFNNIIGQRVLDRLTTTGGVVPGELIKEIQSELGNFVRTAAKAADPDQQALGQAVGAVKDAITDGIARQNPAFGETLKNADRAWAMMVRVEDAAGNRATSGGTFTPGDLLAAAKRDDASVRHRGFSRGDALMQDWAQAGQATIGNKYPDSGSAGRLGQSTATAWGVGAAAAPAVKMLYSAPAGGMMRLWANPSAPREALAEVLRKGLPAVSPGVGGSLAREKKLEELARQLLQNNR